MTVQFQFNSFLDFEIRRLDFRLFVSVRGAAFVLRILNLDFIPVAR